MPVGKVFNAAENQVLISPVTNYYKGKAIRAGLKQAEADLEYKNLQTKALKQALEPNEDEAEKAQLELEQLRLNIEKKRDEIGDAEMQRRADAYGPIIEEATKMAEADDLDGAISFANKELRLAAEKLGPEVLDEFNKALGPDKVLDKEEIARIKYGISAYYEMAGADSTGYAAKDTYEVDGKKYHGWYDDSGKFHKTGILAESSSGEQITFDPPNKAELEVAEDIIKKEIPDLDRSYKDMAAMWLANEIRNRQERHGESYDVAVAISIASIKAKLRKEPDFFSGQDDALSFGGGLKDNEFLCQDGNVYVETEDGFRRKD